jgi:hypothetical protein
VTPGLQGRCPERSGVTGVDGRGPAPGPADRPEPLRRCSPNGGFRERLPSCPLLRSPRTGLLSFLPTVPVRTLDRRKGPPEGSPNFWVFSETVPEPPR